jgi:hypothetical protein
VRRSIKADSYIESEPPKLRENYEYRMRYDEAGQFFIGEWN